MAGKREKPTTKKTTPSKKSKKPGPDVVSDSEDSQLESKPTNTKKKPELEPETESEGEEEGSEVEEEADVEQDSEGEEEVQDSEDEEENVKKEKKIEKSNSGKKLNGNVKGKGKGKGKGKAKEEEESESGEYKLPMRRISRIIKDGDPDIRMSHEATFLINKATEKFLELLAKEAYACAFLDRKNQVAYSHLASVVAKRSKFDFLADFVPEKVRAENALARLSMNEK